MDQIYAFVDNSFLFIQGYKHVRSVASVPINKTPYVDYKGLKVFLAKQGEVKRVVLVGSDLAGSIMSQCQKLGITPFTLPKYPDFKTGKPEEKGVDHKLCWEIAKTIFTNKDPLPNKKIILCTGDKDFLSVLPDIHTSNWAFELWIWKNSYSPKVRDSVQAFGKIRELDDEWKAFIKIGDKKTP
jgi:hypothetical protein